MNLAVGVVPRRDPSLHDQRVSFGGALLGHRRLALAACLHGLCLADLLVVQAGEVYDALLHHELHGHHLDQRLGRAKSGPCMC